MQKLRVSSIAMKAALCECAAYRSICRLVRRVAKLQCNWTDSPPRMLDAPSVISTEAQRSGEYACGDAGGSTGGRDHDRGRSDETGERLGRARVKSFTILRSTMRDVSTPVDMTMKACRNRILLYLVCC